jgi:hypothetical protein
MFEYDPSLMEQLPFIDEHVAEVKAGPQRTWNALLAVLGGEFGSAASTRIARLLGCRPAERSGSWDGGLTADATLPGFGVEEARAPTRLALAGAHRFARYALVFELEPRGDDACSLRAQTFALFPGIAGRAYRALVIGSGGHRLVTRRLLRRIARRV